MTERTITVTDKTGKKIAIFSNMTSVHDNSSKKNIMVAPIVDIVSNGESTLTFQMLANSDKWQQIKNPENLYYCNGRVYTALNEQSIVYDGLTVTVTLVELWYLLKYKYVQIHNTDTKVEALDEHTIKILPKTATKFKLTINGVKYEDSQVKDSRGVVMPRGSAGYALWALLKTTGWTLGICDVLPTGFNAAKDYGTFNVETDMKSILENIQYVQSLYGGILVWDSEHKILHLRDEEKTGSDFNAWKGFVIRQGKNLVEWPSVIWDNNLITRLYPLGSGNLNIGKVNGGENYIDNFSFTSAIYEGYLQNANIYDTNDEGGQRTLKFWGEQQLKKLCRPRKTVKYEIVDKRSTSEGWTEPFDINDIVKAYYADTETGEEIFEYLRIQHITYNWFWPGSDTTIEVGDKVSNATEIFYQVYKDLDKLPKPDENGDISGDRITIEIPDEYWDLFGGFGYTNLNMITQIHAEYIKKTEQENIQAVADLRAYADDTFATITSFTSFEKWTKDEFRSSSTKIDQVSSALQAQIVLEASHYSELDAGLNAANTRITQSNTRIELLSNDLIARIKQEATFRTNDINKLTGELEKETAARAAFEAEASRTYAKTSQLSEYAKVDYVTGAISKSRASIETWASEEFAKISLEASVKTLSSDVSTISQTFEKYGSWLTLTNQYIYMGVGAFGDVRSNGIGVSSSSTSLYGSVYISVRDLMFGTYEASIVTVKSLTDSDHVLLLSR